ncbi:MAG: D-Ala-D-Ala carboxypeptidase family metallohydrolase [Verrucomicrobiota bacterium]|nr:D-Ala-D-Ala carboxypeptidase family metallohydrolase [Verrucomicrobiota bacterium]
MNSVPLQVVDGGKLPAQQRVLLQPAQPVQDKDGNVHHLPRFFYSVASWTDAHAVKLAEHFKLAELMMVDCREADVLFREFPHYVPCAITLLAGFLEGFRRAVESPVFVSANGGYRSPAHRRNLAKSTHCWGTAADIYRVGDNYLDNEKTIARYAGIAESLGMQVYVRPHTHGDDHLHIDLGYVTVTPRDCSDRMA